MSQSDISYFCDVSQLKKTGLDELSNMMVKIHVLLQDDAKIRSSWFNIRVKWTNKLIKMHFNIV